MKKKKGAATIKIGENQFCAVLEDRSDSVTKKYCVIADADNYNLLYQNGVFLGMPCPYGGTIYPFSTDPTKQGSKKDLKQFHTSKVVCLSKDFNLKIVWGGSRFAIEDPTTGEQFYVGARGVLYLNIDPSDAARKADMFYNKCITQRKAEDFDTKSLNMFLKEAFVMHAGAKIQEYVTEKKLPISRLKSLHPSDVMKISAEIFPKFESVFESYGLSLVKSSCEVSLIQEIKVQDPDDEPSGMQRTYFMGY